MKQIEVEQMKQSLHEKARKLIIAQSHESLIIKGLTITATADGFFFLLSNQRYFIPDANYTGDAEFHQLPLWTDEEELAVLKTLLEIVQSVDQEAETLPTETGKLWEPISVEDLTHVLRDLIIQGVTNDYDPEPTSASRTATKIMKRIMNLIERTPTFIRVKDSQFVIQPAFWKAIGNVDDSATASERLGVPYSFNTRLNLHTLKLLKYVAHHPEVLTREMA